MMSSTSGLSKEETIHGFDSTKLMTLQDNLISMTNTTGNMSSLFTSRENASNFFTQRGVMINYANISAIVDPKFIKTISGEKKSPILGNGVKE